MANTGRSRFHIALLGIAAAAACALSTLARTAIDRVKTVCVAAYEVACDWLKATVKKFKQPVLRLVARPVELVQACAYALGLAKRERPRVRDQWRMCPSI
jgi:hypothetical protein